MNEPRAFPVHLVQEQADPDSAVAAIKSALLAAHTYENAIVIGINADGTLEISHSSMLDPEVVWHLMSAIDQTRQA